MPDIHLSIQANTPYDNYLNALIISFDPAQYNSVTINTFFPEHFSRDSFSSVLMSQFFELYHSTNTERGVTTKDRGQLHLGILFLKASCFRYVIGKKELTEMAALPSVNGYLEAASILVRSGMGQLSQSNLTEF